MNKRAIFSPDCYNAFMTWAYTIETGTTDLPPLQETACWETTTTADSHVEFRYNRGPAVAYGGGGWNRYSDPGLGTYTSGDRILEISKGNYAALNELAPSFLNSYAYANGFPNQYVDLDGLAGVPVDKIVRWEEVVGSSFDFWDVVNDNNDTLTADILSIAVGTGVSVGCSKAAAAALFMSPPASLAVGGSCMIAGIIAENLAEQVILEVSGPPILDRDNYPGLFSPGGDFCSTNK